MELFAIASGCFVLIQNCLRVAKLCAHNIMYDVQNAENCPFDGNGTKRVYVDGNLITENTPT